MSLEWKGILTASILVTTLFFVTGCSAEQDAYESNDEKGYHVSVRYDANGGEFTAGTTVIVDSYDIRGLKANSEGKVEIPLLSPNNRFGKVPVSKDGHFLAGWYVVDNDLGGGQIFSDKWDFVEDRLEVDPKAGHTATEPVLTLYAAWLPKFQIEFCAVGSDEVLKTVVYDPNHTQILLPTWDRKKGTLDMGQFPGKEDHTFSGAFYDKEGTKPVTTPAVVHSCVFDEATGTATGTSMRLYVDWIEGEWYHIYTADQFVKNFKTDGNYVIESDLDFTQKDWSSFALYGKFTGTIQGQGHTFSNIDVDHKNTSKSYAGLFGILSGEAQISDLTFQNVTFTIKKGIKNAGTGIGIVAGMIASDAQITNVELVHSKLQIDSDCRLNTDDYAIGLVCGAGASSKIEHSDVTCVPSGDAPEKVEIAVNGDSVTVRILPLVEKRFT